MSGPVSKVTPSNGTPPKKSDGNDIGKFPLTKMIVLALSITLALCVHKVLPLSDMALSCSAKFSCSTVFISGFPYKPEITSEVQDQTKT